MSKIKNKIVKHKAIKLIRKPKNQYFAAVIVIVAAAILGYFLFTASHAASPYSSAEAESGTLGGSTKPTIVTGSSGASGSSYVQFGSLPSSTSYTTPTCTQYCGGTDYGPGTQSTITVKDSLGDSHTVWVYRPPVPDSATLPILYFLHGVTATGEIGWQDDEMFLGPVMNTWLAKGGMPFVLVGPDGEPDDPSVHNQSLWVNSADGQDPIETYVSTQTVAAVEGSNVRDRSHRAIAGFSMGGYGAANLALRNSSLYGQAAPFAGFFSTTYDGLGYGVFNEVNGTYNSAADTANTPSDNMGTAASMRWWVSDASDDANTYVNTQSGPFISLLQSKGAYVQSDLKTTGGHTWTYIQQEFPVALKDVIVPGWGGTSGSN